MPTSRLARLAGAALCASFLLPAMARSGGGSYSSVQYLLQAQSSDKLSFVLGGVVGVAAIGASFARRDRTRGALLVGLSLLIIALHAPSFGDAAGLGWGVCWPLVCAVLASALSLGASRAPLLAAVLGAIAGALVVPSRPNVPNELQLRELHYEASLLRSVAEGLAKGGPPRWMAAFYLPALVLPIAVGAWTALRPTTPRGFRLAALLAVGGLGLGWIVASAFGHGFEANFLWVRARVALVWGAAVALCAVGALDLRRT